MRNGLGIHDTLIPLQCLFLELYLVSEDSMTSFEAAQSPTSIAEMTTTPRAGREDDS